MNPLVNDIWVLARAHRWRLIGLTTGLAGGTLVLAAGLASAQCRQSGVGTLSSLVAILTTWIVLAPTLAQPRAAIGSATREHRRQFLVRILFVCGCAGATALCTAAVATVCAGCYPSHHPASPLQLGSDTWPLYTTAAGLGLWVMAASRWLVTSIFAVPLAALSLWVATGPAALVLGDTPEFAVLGGACRDLLEWYRFWADILPVGSLGILMSLAGLAAAAHSFGILGRTRSDLLHPLLRGLVQTGLLTLACLALSQATIHQRARFDPAHHHIADIWWDPAVRRGYVNVQTHALVRMAYEVDLHTGVFSKVGGPTEMGMFVDPHPTWGRQLQPQTALLAYQEYRPRPALAEREKKATTRFLVATDSGTRYQPNDRSVPRFGPLVSTDGRRWTIGPDTLIASDGVQQTEVTWDARRTILYPCGLGFCFYDPSLSAAQTRLRIHDLERGRSYAKPAGLVWVLPRRWLVINNTGEYGGRPLRRLFDPDSGSYAPTMNRDPDDRVFAMFTDGSVLVIHTPSDTRTKPSVYRVHPETGRRREIPTPEWVNTSANLVLSVPITGRLLLPTVNQSVMVLDPGADAFRSCIGLRSPWTTACFDVGTADSLPCMNEDFTALVRCDIATDRPARLLHRLLPAAPLR